ncbi:MerR family transcriptional regulator [Nocardioides anomalus]|uniref:MerR family transcriptional regulator n=1 Tax=Nocardioides anomalus TaxID=2712223 RepID=A0A6G6WAN2_9ACTN|nr:MerR family transcriptional regulator [Nocardioides anomalus]QIG42284.1 MerR family transcriptional regulator [Nocardioides anomalus]
MAFTIGEVAARTGLTQRSLRYYEELGLLEPRRSDGGRREYDGAALDRLYRIRLQRSLGTPVAEVDADADLLTAARRHLRELDDVLADTARQRERVRTVEARLLRGEQPHPSELLDLLAGLGDGDEPFAVRRLTLLVYRDVLAAHAFLVEVFGFAPGPASEEHAEVFVGDGVVWLHHESLDYGLLSPVTSGSASHCMAVDVDDVEAHHARTSAAGAEIAYPPTTMPYGVREYAARDREGGLWSFMQPLPDEEE